MANKKTIRFRYYKACLVRKPSISVTLETYLAHILNVDNYKDKKINNTDSSVSINSIKKYKNYRIPDGATLSYPIWAVTFSKSRIDVPGIINIKTKHISSVNINDDELITDESVLLYDETTNVIMLQCNRGSAPPTYIQHLINSFIPKANKDDELCLIPLYYENSFERALKQNCNKNLTVRIIKTAKEKYNDLDKKVKTDTVSSVISTLNDFDTNEERDLQIELSVSAKGKGHKNSLNSRTVLNFIQSVAPFIQCKTISKLQISGYSEDATKQQVIDLIADPIFDTANFEVTSSNRRILPTTILKNMVIEYNKRRQDFLLAGLE